MTAAHLGPSDWTDDAHPPAPIDDSAVDDDRTDEAPADTAPALHFPTLPAFVGYLADLYRREVFDSAERTWCPRWWDHPEAVARLEAMWRAFEALRQDPATGISIWFRDHADTHMAQLMQPHGPFRGCSAKRGHSVDPLVPLPLEEVPEGWWPEAHSGP